MKITIYTDGAARGNPGPSASGYMIRDHNDKLIEANSIYNGLKTNNYAEYNAVIHALEWCIKNMKSDELEVELYSDSELVVRQIEGKYKIKAEGLKELNEKVKEMSKRFKKLSFHNVPREHEGISSVDKALNALLDLREK